MKESLDDKQKAFSVMFWGLTASLSIEKRHDDPVTILHGIAWKRDDWMQQLITALMLAGISSGSFDEANVSNETLNAICADFRMPSAVAAWEADMAQACAQNRALYQVGDSNE